MQQETLCMTVIKLNYFFVIYSVHPVVNVHVHYIISKDFVCICLAFVSLAHSFARLLNGQIFPSLSPFIHYSERFLFFWTGLTHLSQSWLKSFVSLHHSASLTGQLEVEVLSSEPRYLQDCLLWFIWFVILPSSVQTLHTRLLNVAIQTCIILFLLFHSKGPVVLSIFFFIVNLKRFHTKWDNLKTGAVIHPS